MCTRSSGRDLFIIYGWKRLFFFQPHRGSRGGRPLAVADRIRLDHGALTALMVPPPDASIVNSIRSILQVHNALEEQEGGMYSVCEQLAEREAESLLRQLKSVPEVPLHPHNPKSEILEVTRRAVERAGHTLKPG